MLKHVSSSQTKLLCNQTTLRKAREPMVEYDFLLSTQLYSAIYITSKSKPNQTDNVHCPQHTSQ